MGGGLKRRTGFIVPTAKRSPVNTGQKEVYSCRTTAPTAVQRWMVMGMRLIDADELKERILVERRKIPLTCPGASYEFYISKPYQHGNSMRGGIRKALRCMEQCKTVDAVPVVRCKDCKFFHDKGYCTKTTGLTRIKPDYYCSYGERKDNEQQK